MRYSPGDCEYTARDQTLGVNYILNTGLGHIYLSSLVISPLIMFLHKILKLVRLAVLKYGSPAKLYNYSWLC